MLEMILATDLKGGIGKGGQLPWYLSEDLRLFKRLTSGSDLICGRKTAESLPVLGSGRRVHVLSRTPEDELNLKKGQCLYDYWGDGHAFVIGGAQIYQAYAGKVERVWHTLILGEYDCDVRVDLDALFDGYSEAFMFNLSGQTEEGYRAQVRLMVRDS